MLSQIEAGYSIDDDNGKSHVDSQRNRNSDNGYKRSS